MTTLAEPSLASQFFQKEDAQTNAFICKVYAWMCVALSISFITSFVISKITFLEISLVADNYFWGGLITSEIFIIFYLSRWRTLENHHLSAVLFVIFSVLQGISFTTIFFLFSIYSIFVSFIISAIIFIILSLFGYFTRYSLTKLGSACFSGLLALVCLSIAALVFPNLFSNFLNSAANFSAILIFCGAIAADTQMIKKYYYSAQQTNFNQINNLAIFGAIGLYLDFINLFLQILLRNKK